MAGEGNADELCKVGRVLSKYDFEEYDEELQREWLAENGASLRDLESRFNQHVLRRAMERAGENPLNGEVENVYRLLTDDDVSAGEYTQAKNRLRKLGIDFDELTDDFVSYQSINRHLQQCRNVTKDSRKPSASPQKLRSRIFSLESRTANVTESTLEQLRRHDELNVSDPSVFVELNVVCEICGAIMNVEDALAGKACDCADDSE